MKENNFISIVLYYHNVNSKINMEFPQKLFQDFLINFKNYEIIIANDSSEQDNINNLIDNLNKFVEHNTISVINFPDFVGIETAMLAGDDMAIGDYIYEFDTLNMEFEGSILMKAYYKLMEGYDIVSVGNTSSYQPWTSKIFYRIYNNGVKYQKRITSEAFRIVSRRAFNRAKAMTKNIEYRKAIYASSGLKRYYFEENTIKILNKFDKNETDKRLQLGINSLIIFTNIIQRFSVFLSCLFLLITVIISIYIIGVFTVSKPVAGWTPIMMYLSIGFFGIFSLLAIILKYLSVILNMIYKKDLHVIESIRKV